MTNIEPWVTRAMEGVGAEEMRGIFPWAPAMDACLHDPIHHAEGSPWVHTHMVVSALEGCPDMAMLTPERQAVVRLAAWAHDIGKPATTVLEDIDGRTRVRQPGHAALGARMIWQSLIDQGACPQLARDVHALVFWHMRPPHLIDQDIKKLTQWVIGFSVEAGGGSWRDLLALTTADQNGRISLETPEKHLPVDLLREAILDIERASDVDVTSRSWPFSSDEARLTFMRGTKESSAWYTPPEPTGSKVTIMSGLPGSGKDTWIKEHRPGMAVVSLDDIRQAMDVDPTDNQGRVIQAAYEAARVHLRKGEDFIWNATCLIRPMRQKISGLARDYNARIEAVSMDVPLAVALDRNRGRALAVPDKIIQKLALKREPVMPDEAHTLYSCNANGVMTAVFGKKIEEPGFDLDLSA